MKNSRLFEKAKTVVLDLIFPKKCVGCFKVGVWLCNRCLVILQQERPKRRQVDNITVVACGSYKNKVLQRIIDYIKYKGVVELAEAGGKLLAGLASTMTDDNFDLVTAVPLHRQRLAERTFNQAELLAKNLSKLLEIKYADLLERSRYSESQTHLADDERRSNVKDIFKIKSTGERLMIGRSILLVDDVVTSGATIAEAARALIDHGAARVTGICLASR